MSEYMNVADPEISNFEGWEQHLPRIAALEELGVDVSGLHAIVEDGQIVGVGCREPIPKITWGLPQSAMPLRNPSAYAREPELLGLMVLSFLAREEAIMFYPPGVTNG